MVPGHGQVDGRMEGCPHDAGSMWSTKPRSGLSVWVLGRASLPLDLHSFICIVRGWSEVFLILTVQRLRTHVIKNSDKEGRNEYEPFLEKMTYELLLKADSIELRKCLEA